MDTGNLTPQPQARPPRSRLTWLWPVITHVLLLGSIGFWISSFSAITNHLPIQFIGSGWWRDGGMALAALLWALMGFSVKLSALITRRVPRILWLPATNLLRFNIEIWGVPLFLGYGILPLFIHSSDPFWPIVSGYSVVAIVALITMIKPVRRRLVAVLGSTEHGAQSLVAEPAYLSRRALLSGGLILGIGAAGVVTFWRTLPALIPEYTFFGHDNTLRSLSWFPDSRHITSTNDGTPLGKGKVLIWNADDGSDLRTLASFGEGSNWAYVSPNGAFIAVSEGYTLSIWDAATGASLWTTSIAYGARQFSWAPDSTRLVVVRSTDSGRDLGIVDVHARTDVKTAFTLPERFYPDAVAWSPDGRLIAAADWSRFIIWDASSGIQQDIRMLPPTKNYEMSDFAWSPDGRSLAIALDRVVYIWPLSNAAPSVAYREFSDDVFDIAFSWSPDGRYIASCSSEEQTVRVWEAATGKTAFVYNGHFSSVKAVAWSPDGRRIASGGYDNLVHVWRPVLPA